jgi:hypothetical protein
VATTIEVLTLTPGRPALNRDLLVILTLAMLRGRRKKSGLHISDKRLKERAEIIVDRSIAEVKSWD